MSERKKVGIGWLKKHKTLTISTAVIIFGIGFWGWQNSLKEIIAPKRETSYFSGEIDQFCVNNICLKKDSEKWRVSDGKSNEPANKEIIDAYLQRLTKISLGNVASVNHDNFASLGIGVSQVLLTINNKSLEIGKINSNYDGTYVRQAEGDIVYVIDTVLDKQHLQEMSQWQNRTLTNLAELQTTKITFEKGGETVTIIPQNGEWKQEKVVEKICHLTAEDYLDEFIPNKETEKIGVSSGDSLTIINLGMIEDGNKNPVYWATIDGKDYYSISDKDYDLLTGKIN